MNSHLVVEVFERKGEAYVNFFGRDHPRTKRFYVIYHIWSVFYQFTLAYMFIFSSFVVGRMFARGIEYTVRWIRGYCTWRDG